MFWSRNMGNKKVVKKTNISNTHVPDKVYAYMIQSHHMLYELLNCEKGDSVSVEVFDDVGVEHPDGSRDAIQLKSALSNRNPVSNKAIDLWKTMYNWMLSAETGELDPENTKYILFINVNKKGTIVDKFHSVKSTEEAIDAWNKTKEIFYDEEGKLKEIGEECRKYVEYFYKDEKKDLALKIIEKFKYKKCIEDYTITVRNEFNKSGIPEDIIDPIYVGIIGWIDIKVTKMVEAGQPIAISLEDYQKQLRALYREYNQKHSLMTYSVEPSDQEIEQEFQKKRVYIEQLDIIDCDYTEKVEAINDYLRAAIDRATWAENGDISMQSIQTYESNLKRTWKLQKRIVMLEKKNESSEDQGKMIYYACSWFGIIVKIDEKKLLLARREPGQHKVTDDMMLMENEICPFCGSKHNVDGQMRELIGNLEDLEEESEEIAEIPVAFEREYSIVQGKISELTERLGAVQKSIKIQNNKKDETYNQKYTLESVSRFLGKLQYAEETYRAIGYDGELQEEISELQKKIIVLQNEINEGGIRKRFASALENIELKIMKLLPLLDTERPEDSVKIDYKNLTITVTSKSGRKDYLWEIGSGSNWLSYHISVSLAFQMFFAEKKYSPIPQFIVYDQPSQVYFPNKAAQKEEDKDVDPHLEDEDILAVKKIFEAMSEAMEKTKHRMQIIVLEHADESAWEGVSNMHLVEEWRGENNKLIPNEWLD